MTKANLTEADLTGTYLTKANLTEANLTGAYLPEANLTKANLPEANLTETNLTGADLVKSTVILPQGSSDLNVTNTDFSGALIGGDWSNVLGLEKAHWRGDLFGPNAQYEPNTKFLESFMPASVGLREKKLVTK